MFEDAIRKLQDLQRRAEELHGEHRVTLHELFSEEFMLRNTDHASIDDMVKANGFSADSQEAFDAIPDEDWDRIVRQQTRFSSWEEMQQAAASEWAMKRLDLN